MEQLSGPCGWAVLGPTPEPGQVRLWSYQAVAHGADAIVYFRWRPALFGTEQYWHGILDHDGSPRRRYREVSDVAREFKSLSPELDQTAYPADVLILRSFDNLWSQRFQPHADGLDYENQLQRYFDAFAAYGAQLDVAALPDDPAHYRIIAAPLLNLTTPDVEKSLASYVEQGGTLILTFRSGTRDWNNSMREAAPPGPFAELVGVAVEEFDALSDRRSVKVVGPKVDGTAKLWVDILTVSEDVEVVASYQSGYFSGSPAIAKRPHGKGTVYYIGCDLDHEALTGLIGTISEEASVFSVRKELLENPPECVEAAIRAPAIRAPAIRAPAIRAPAAGGGNRELFLLNHSDETVEVRLRIEARNLLSANKASSISLEPWGVAVLEIE